MDIIVGIQYGYYDYNHIAFGNITIYIILYVYIYIYIFNQKEQKNIYIYILYNLWMRR